MQLEAHVRVSIRKNANTGVDLNENIKHTVKPCPCGGGDPRPADFPNPQISN